MRKLGLSLLALAMAACGGSSSSSNPWPSASEIKDQSFTGAIGDGSVLTVHVGAAAPALLAVGVAVATTPAQGTIGSTSLDGSYDPATGELSLTGGLYDLQGTYANGAIVGTVDYDGDTYSFVAAIGDDTKVTVYCGTYTGPPPDSDTGAFTLMISGGYAWGVTDMGQTFHGSVDGKAISMVVDGKSNPISGSIKDDGTVQGEFTNSDGTGSWSGSTTACK